VAAAAAARTQGHLPASIQRIVDALLVPKLDWRRILAEFLTPSRSDWDWRRPDRRILAASGFHIPSLHSEDLEDVVVAIDTSGSIGQDELETFLAEVCEILATSHRTRAWVLTCDAELHAVVEASEQTTPEELAPALNGGGGTDFRPVFDWIRDRGISPACVVYLTDGYGTYPEQQPPYPVLWVLTRDHMTPPWGKTALLEV
jgi:predicted metal-dependent peptidase